MRSHLLVMPWYELLASAALACVSLANSCSCRDWYLV
jgi:hypothetical protein